MENGQNLANEMQKIDEAVLTANQLPLPQKQQLWIDYNALDGLITDNTQDWRDKDGNPMSMRKMPIKEFADMIGVSRETLRLWRTAIPNFWAKVNSRRVELAPQSRLQKMHEVWFLSALTPGSKGFRDRQMWLANFDENFVMPTQNVKHDVGNNLAELLQVAKRDGIIEGEVIDVPADHDAGASGQNPGAHPATP